MNNLAKKLSIIAGLITAFSLAYTGISPIWHLPFAEEIQQTAAVIVVLLSGILSAFTGQKLITSKNQQENVEALKEIAETNKKLASEGFFKGIVDVPDVEKNTPTDLAEKHAQFEAEGGQGAVYSVPVGSYDSFRNAVIGKGYDIDGYYGFQCWDGVALLWQQLGKSLSTGGTGAAKGCWTAARVQNAGTLFDTLTDSMSLKRGDVAVFGGGQFGHIAFVDSVNNDGTVNLLGQNQTGSGNGAPFNIIRMSLSNFIGAFRLKSWVFVPTPVPTPQPAPVQGSPKKSNEEIAVEVQRGNWGNNPERKQRLEAAGYDYHAIQAIVNSRVNTAVPALSNTSGKPQIGDRVTTTDTHDQNGALLNLAIINDGQSVFSEVNSKGNAVLKKGGVVRAGVTVGSLRKV